MLSLDLNLLTVFDALMKMRSVTRASLEVGLSQPGVSLALQRLRKHFNDPLFVRARNEMTPTSRALALYPPIQQGLALLTGGLVEASPFEPSSSTATFRLLISDMGEAVLLPPLMQRLQKAAPHVVVEIVQLPRGQYRSALEAGAADLAYGNLPMMGTSLYQQSLFKDSYACLVRTGHPRVGKTLTLHRFLEESHLSAGVAPSQVEINFQRLKIKRKVVLTVHHYMVAPAIVRSTDLLATVPRSVTRFADPVEGLRTMKLPVTMPDFTVKQFWHERRHHDAGHRWFRGVMSDLIGHYDTD